MNIKSSELCREERAIFELRGIYEQYGYEKYKISKFEEYALYLENKSFLPSPEVITFTDKNGRLLALKPDVTLSIAKNARNGSGEPEKLYYNENVFRMPRASGEFREIMQLGLEYIGEVDLYAECEVLSLAAKSLEALSEKCVLVVSHMGFVAGLLGECGLTNLQKEKILSCIGSKNSHETERLCHSFGLERDLCQAVSAVCSLHGSFEETIKKAGLYVKNEKMQDSLSLLNNIWQVLKEDFNCLLLDFSVINDLSYYNGLIFQGFIDGVPGTVLSGGRYDELMRRLGKDSQAIGFAVYTDQLENMERQRGDYDLDVLLLYDDKAEAEKLSAAVRMLTSNGQRVRAQKVKSDRLSYKQLLRLGEGGLEILETNA